MNIHNRLIICLINQTITHFFINWIFAYQFDYSVLNLTCEGLDIIVVSFQLIVYALLNFDSFNQNYYKFDNSINTRLINLYYFFYH